jgi:hypothetical protein
MRVPDWGLLLKGGRGRAELGRGRERGFEFWDEGWFWAIYIDASWLDIHFRKKRSSTEKFRFVDSKHREVRELAVERTKSAIVEMKCGEMGLIDAMLHGCINILAIDIDIPSSQVQYTLEHIA